MSQDESGFGSEYAKSDRSSCRLCHNTISMGALRLAVYVQVNILANRNLFYLLEILFVQSIKLLSLYVYIICS